MYPLEILFVVALVLYSLVIWTHKFSKKLKLWMVGLFGIGLAADIGGTVFLCVVVSEGWIFNLHTIFGLVSLVIMALHFFWAVRAISRGGNWEIYFDRFSVYAWCFWLAAFITGIP